MKCGCVARSVTIRLLSCSCERRHHGPPVSDVIRDRRGRRGRYDTTPDRRGRDGARPARRPVRPERMGLTSHRVSGSSGQTRRHSGSCQAIFPGSDQVSFRGHSGSYHVSFLGITDNVLGHTRCHSGSTRCCSRSRWGHIVGHTRGHTKGHTGVHTKGHTRCRTI